MNDMTEQWETQFNPRRAVAQAEEFVAASKLKSDQAHAKFTDIEELRYGNSPLSNLDMRRASKPGQPLFVFIHGGYWRGRDKNDFGYLFEAMAPSDVNVAVLNYDLCPSVTVRQISTQIRDAILWLHDNSQTLGFDPEQVYVAGHSAGAHLAAMILARAPAEFSLPEGMIRKVYLISGIYELSPVLRISVNQEIRLTQDEVEPLSPVKFAPAQQTQYDVIVGEDEPQGWVKQSTALAAHLESYGIKPGLTVLPGRHHYSILQDMETPSSLLATRFINDMKGNET